MRNIDELFSEFTEVMNTVSTINSPIEQIKKYPVLICDFLKGIQEEGHTEGLLKGIEKGKAEWKKGITN